MFYHNLFLHPVCLFFAICMGKVDYYGFYRAYLDCHLMVTNPLDYVEPLGDAGASGFTFHVEVSRGSALILFLVLIAWTFSFKCPLFNL